MAETEQAGQDEHDDPAAIAETGEAVAAPEVPQDLNLGIFKERRDFVDCGVRLPVEEDDQGDGQIISCHRVVLCSASGYFFRRFVYEGTSLQTSPLGDDGQTGPVVDLPPLPKDDELKRQVDLVKVFDLVLSFVYGGQVWESIEQHVTAENAMGLFALGELLEIRPLAMRAFEFLETSVLGPESATRLLYAATRLANSSQSGSSASSFQGPAMKCTEVLKRNFSQAVARPGDLDLLSKLPVPILAPILEADDIDVPAEALVLDVARRVLRSRMPREEIEATLAGARLAGGSVSFVAGFVGGTIFEVFVIEEPQSVFEAQAQASKYTAMTAKLQLDGSAGGEFDIGQDLTLQVPKSAVGPGKTGAIAVRLRSFASEDDVFGEAILGGSLACSSLPFETEDGVDAEVALTTVDGRPSGAVHFKWCAKIVQRVPAEESAPENEESSPEKKQNQFGDAIGEEEVSRILNAVRFQHLEHKDLLAAVKDSVLIEAGAQHRILEALSSRLNAYEDAGVQDGNGHQAPRPSTLRPNGIGGGHSEQNIEASALLPKGLATDAVSPASGAHAPGGSGPGVIRGRRPGSGPGAGGHPLHPCGACGGAVVLRQRDLRWSAECSRYPSACGNCVLLPSSIMGAAVDGHCATCTLRLKADVRTLTVRVGHHHAAALLKLPGGVDTLRGICIAGCNNTLSALGE